MKAWILLIKERFPPGAYLPLVTVFTLANIMVASYFFNSHVFSIFKLIVIWFLSLSFFFRLRLFDELKDVDTDKINHPERPLARGLIPINTVKYMIVMLLLTELLVTYLISLNAFLIQAIAIIYSLLMYKEFFLGKYLRPHLTLYAVTHTAVSILLGYSIAVQYINIAFWAFPRELFLFGIANWSLFNVFEFARKTFSIEEETSTRESYSKIFGLLGACQLTASQSLIAIVILYIISGFSLYLWIHISLFILFYGFGIFFIRSGHANRYRLIWSIYIILFYMIVVIMFSNKNQLW